MAMPKSQDELVAAVCRTVLRILVPEHFARADPAAFLTTDPQSSGSGRGSPRPERIQILRPWRPGGDPARPGVEPPPVTRRIAARSRDWSSRRVDGSEHCVEFTETALWNLAQQSADVRLAFSVDDGGLADAPLRHP